MTGSWVWCQNWFVYRLYHLFLSTKPLIKCPTECLRIPLLPEISTIPRKGDCYFLRLTRLFSQITQDIDFLSKKALVWFFESVWRMVWSHKIEVWTKKSKSVCNGTSLFKILGYLEIPKFLIPFMLKIGQDEFQSPKEFRRTEINLGCVWESKD